MEELNLPIDRLRLIYILLEKNEHVDLTIEFVDLMI